jgi:hypothetical protein
MKIRSDFALRSIAGTWVALPLGEATVDFTGMLTLNETGVMLWRMLENGCTKEEMTAALLDEYEVARDEAEADVDAFVKKLSDAGCIDL